MSLLKIATIFLILIASSVLCSLSIELLPVIEDPVLLQFGVSIELQNINYFCDSLQVARDYSPGASIEDLCEGADSGLKKSFQENLSIHFMFQGHLTAHL